MRLWVAALAVLVLAGGVWFATRTAGRDAPRAAPPLADAPPGDPAALAAARPAVDPPRPGADFSEAPEVERYRESIAFRDDLRAFFADARALPEAERAARSSALLAQLDAQERDGRVLPEEAHLIRLAVLRVTVDDPAVLESETRRVNDDYRRHVERAAANRIPDPRDGEYQVRQAEIAREVMALDEIPDGLSREDYLRRRLRDLRIEVYADGAPAPE
jgi:hypothetical protein